MHYAHSVEGRPKSEWQRLDDHLKQVGMLADEFAKTFRAERAAALAGRLHDLGKYSRAFQARLDGSPTKVDHATAGAKQVRELAETREDRLVAELIAYVIAGHHAGLPDKIGGESSLADRLKKPTEELAPVWKTELSLDATKLWPGLRLEKICRAFQLAFLGRMIFSCLIDADRRDTEAFCAQAEGWKPDRDWPRLGESSTDFSTFNAHMSDKQSRRPMIRPSIACAAKSSTMCGRAPPSTPGLFTLTVPTGGGKTLASLAFALDHAKRTGSTASSTPFRSRRSSTKRRTSSASVLGDEFVLEHHSAIDEETCPRARAAPTS